MAVRALRRLRDGSGEPAEEVLSVKLVMRDSVKNVALSP